MARPARPPAGNHEFAALIETLGATERRLAELTGGEVDSVVDADGRILLLRHAQEQLRHSDAARQTAVLNALPAHIALIDAQGHIVSVNDAWRRFAVANQLPAPGHAQGMDYLRVCDDAAGDDTILASEAAHGIRAVLAGGAPSFSMEYPCHSPSLQRWFLMTVTPLAQDRLNGAVVMHLDITERKRHEEELVRFGAAMDSVADAIYLTDRESMRFVHVNDAACRMQGKTRAEILALGPAGILSASIAELESIYDAVIARGGESDPLEMLRQREDGSEAWVELRRHAVRSGERWMIVTLVRDVTRRKQSLEALRLSEGLNRAIVDGSLDCLVTIDHLGRIVEFNPAAVATFGWTRDQAIGKAMVDLIVPERLRAQHRRGFARYLATGQGPIMGKLLELSAVRSDGSEFPIELSIALLKGTSEPVFAGFIRDITVRKEAEARLKRLNRVHAVMSGINMLIVRVRDLDELFREACGIAVDAGGFRIAHIVLSQADGTPSMPGAAAGEDNALIADLREVMRSPETYGQTMVARAMREGRPMVSNDSRTDHPLVLGTKYREAGIHAIAALPLIVGDTVRGVLVLYSGDAEFFDDDEMKLLNGLAGDIALAIDHIGKRDLLDYLAYYDSLTGLANRTLFLERVGAWIRGAETGGHGLAIFLIDLERFKNITDSLGRRAGDALLSQVGQWLTRIAGDAKLVARLDADHFAVVLPKVAAAGNLVHLVEKAMGEFHDHPFQLEDAVFRVAAKLGAAVFPGDGTDAETLFRNAEAALKKAKAGGARYLFHTREMTHAVAGKLTLENRLRDAVDKSEFVLHYQPKVSLGTGELIGAEALIRWNDPLTGLVPPGRFIPMLEETGLIYEVGRWALGQALRDYLRCKAEGLAAVRIAVNVSPLQLRHRGFVEEIAAIVGTHPNAAEGLELEITESLIMEDVRHSIASLEQIRALGVTVAIDDFGTGFSSLSYLARLPVDTLKIDRSFVVDMTSGPQGLALVSTIINLAHSLRLKVVAEGVETEEQSRLLTLLGCDEMQGFLFSKPVPAELYELRFLAPPAARMHAALAAAPA